MREYTTVLNVEVMDDGLSRFAAGFYLGMQAELLLLIKLDYR